VGDPEKPRLAFFFDEAHLLFNDAPPSLLEKVEQMVRLIRSKGVGVYFVTQNPLDVPDVVLGQLGNRVQHALRAFSPRDQKAVKAAAQTFRQNVQLDTETAITQLGVGEALVSFLDEKGIPSEVQRAWILPPAGQIGPITPEERQKIIKESILFGHYEQMIDRESAFEILRGRAEEAVKQTAQTAEQKRAKFQAKQAEVARQETERQSKKPGLFQRIFAAFTSSAAHRLGNTIGKEIERGVLGSIFGGGGSSRRKRN
jgi:DNA helicase HerA-like ATPase